MLWLRFDPWSQRFCMPQVWPKKKKPNKQTNGKVLGLWAQGQRTGTLLMEDREINCQALEQARVASWLSSQIQRTLYLEKRKTGISLQHGSVVQPALKLKERIALVMSLRNWHLFSTSKAKDKGKSPLSHTRAWRYYLKTMEPWKIFKLSLLDKLRLQGLSSLQYQKPNSN